METSRRILLSIALSCLDAVSWAALPQCMLPVTTFCFTIGPWQRIQGWVLSARHGHPFFVTLGGGLPIPESLLLSEVVLTWNSTSDQFLSPLMLTQDISLFLATHPRLNLHHFSFNPLQKLLNSSFSGTFPYESRLTSSNSSAIIRSMCWDDIKIPPRLCSQSSSNLLTQTFWLV